MGGEHAKKQAEGGGGGGDECEESGEHAYVAADAHDGQAAAYAAA